MSAICSKNEQGDHVSHKVIRTKVNKRRRGTGKYDHGAMTLIFLLFLLFVLLLFHLLRGG